MTIRCVFGHAKEYVAVRVGVPTTACAMVFPPIYEVVTGSEARWVCKRSGCVAMGLDSYRGTMAIQHGKIVPDHKAWANWEDD